MELLTEEFIRAVSSYCELLLSANSYNSILYRITSVPSHEHTTLGLCHPSDSLQTRIRGLAPIQNRPEGKSDPGYGY